MWYIVTGITVIIKYTLNFCKVYIAISVDLPALDLGVEWEQKVHFKNLSCIPNAIWLSNNAITSTRNHFGNKVLLTKGICRKLIAA